MTWDVLIRIFHALAPVLGLYALFAWVLWATRPDEIEEDR